MNDSLIRCFEDTIRRCGSTELKAAVERSIGSSVVYREGFISRYFVPVSDADLSDGHTAGAETDISVESTTTLAAAARYRTLGRTAVLNFANPEVPGGGVRNGAVAQEESLCRCSSLYPCLAAPEVFDDFYGYHFMHGRFLYSDRVIYTPGVIVFKDDALNLMDRSLWYKVDVLTCAAPLTARLQCDTMMLAELFRLRIKNILNVALENRAEVLILGAFGCGAFRNPPEIVAGAFREVIEEGQYRRFFKKIVFAIKSSTDDPLRPCPNLTAFGEAKKAQTEKADKSVI